MKKLFYLCLMTCSSILLADETPSMELKHKSSFNVEANERNPFWPIGWKPAPRIHRSRSIQKRITRSLTGER